MKWNIFINFFETAYNLVRENMRKFIGLSRNIALDFHSFTYYATSNVSIVIILCCLLERKESRYDG
jgi:hypothetical protein